MQALQFSVSIPRFLLLKALGLLSRRFYYKGPLATIRCVDMAEPSLPSEHWVKIKTRLCGFCASDLNLIFLKDSPTASPFTSFPCVLGHEMVGEVIEVGAQVTTVNVGDRVTAAPHLSCEARGIEPRCQACQSGQVGSCENFAEGDLAPGMFIGICKDTGGGMGEVFVAHKRQVFRLPETISDQIGILIEPLAVAIQAVWDNRPGDGDQVLVVGSGVIGSLIIQVIRSLGINCTITVSEPSNFHADIARKAGADHVIRARKIFKHTHKVAGAKIYKPMLGQKIAMGGYKRVFDVVATSETLNLATRCMATDGELSIVGIGHDAKLDLTPVWLKIQNLKGVFSCGIISLDSQPKHVFQVAIDMIQKNRNLKIFLEDMVTHQFGMDQYPELIQTNLKKSRHRAVKTAVKF